MKKKIVITGVAGLLGSRLAEWILENTNHKVIGIDDLSGGYINNVHKDVGFYKFDLVEGDQLNHVFEREMPDIVYHFAALSDVVPSIEEPIE